SYKERTINTLIAKNYEAFLISYTPISTITIFTALYKRVEAHEWTDNREKEVANFIEVVDKVLNTIHMDEKDRLVILKVVNF
ncbi:622_t:CDS:1, partial [Entrophospora sp. SA101]